MSPEKGSIASISMLSEAERIKDALIKVQSNVKLVASETEDGLLANIRSELGYQDPDKVKVSGIVDSRIESKMVVITPGAISKVLPLSKSSVATTTLSRSRSRDILLGKDDRLIAVVGPCSIHDPDAGLEYAAKVKEWRSKYAESLEIIMRTYIEKPRTELGWKGLIYDPRLDESNDINLGIVVTRMLACQITHLGVPIAVERLNANTPQYLNGLVTYDAIGARNTTDQKAREYASGTSSVVGFKNTPEGSIKAAVQAVKSANAPHTFLGLSMNGMPMQVQTKGNETAHVILRGNEKGANYSSKHVAEASHMLRSKGLLDAIVVDASHANSNKEYDKQFKVIRNIRKQLAAGEYAIRGIMIESNLVEGSQELDPLNPGDLIYGKSITDGCVGLDETEEMLKAASSGVKQRRKV